MFLFRRYIEYNRGQRFKVTTIVVAGIRLLKIRKKLRRRDRVNWIEVSL